MKKTKPIQTRSSEDTKERIMKAATKVFARTGFDGARIDRIAAVAKVNKQMLYHHFGNKDALFTAVLERAYRSIREQESKVPLTGLKANEAILALVEFTWNYYLANPDFIRLLNSENQMEARHLKASEHTSEINQGHLVLMRRLIDQGKKERSIRNNLDPLQLSINISALGFFYLMNRHTLSTVFQQELNADALLDQRLAVMKDVIERWIAA